MCKFHKDVAREIATDPQTGKVNKTKYQIALAALSKWWVEQYIPEVRTSGYSAYEMANKHAQEIFLSKGLQKPDSVIEDFKKENIPFLRAALDTVIKSGGYSFSFKDKDFDRAMKEFYEGNPYKELTLVEKTSSAEFVNFHQAVASFFSTPHVEGRLRTMLENNIAKLFQDASKKISGFLLKQYDKYPSFRKVFNACACGVGATGGFLASHAGCVISPSLTFITAASGAVGNAIAIVSSVAVTTLGLYIWHKIRGEAASKTERRLTFASAVLGASLAVGIHLSGAHHANHSDAEHLAEAKEWIQKFPPTMVDSMKDSAKALNMTWDDYLSQEYNIACGQRGKQQIPQLTLRP